MSDIFVDNIKHQSSQGSGTITLGASGEKYAGFAKGLATFQVALSQGVAIANAVSQVKGLTGIDLIIQIAAITQDARGG